MNRIFNFYEHMVLFFSKELAKLPKYPSKKLKNALKFKNKFRESKNRKISIL